MTEILHESKLRKSPTFGKIALALAKAQGEMQSAEMDAFNPHLKSKFSSLPAVQKVIRGPLSKNEIAIVQSGHTMSNGNVEVTTLLAHASGEWFEASMILGNPKGTNQGAGSAMSYGKRYQAMGMTGISGSEDDDDGHDSSQPKSTKPENTKAWKEVKKEQAKPKAKVLTTIYDHPEFEWVRDRWTQDPEQLKMLTKRNSIDEISELDIKFFDVLKQTITASDEKKKNDKGK
jgi:hypothetical protein